MTRVTLDSNIYVSAMEFSGIGVRFLGVARAGEIRIDVTEAILSEVVGALRDKFGWEAYRLHFARLELSELANVVTTGATLDVANDPDDNRILEGAVAAGSDFIVTL